MAKQQKQRVGRRVSSRGYFVIPRAKLDEINQACEAAGLGHRFFSIPLYKGNSQVATHYAAAASLWPDQWANLVAVLDEAKVPDAVHEEPGRLGKASLERVLGTKAANDKVTWSRKPRN